MTKAAALFTALLITICALVTPISAYAKYQDTASQMLGGICDNKRAGGSIQGWIDGTLTDNAGVTGEWYIMALAQSGSYDFSSYEKALKSYLANNKVPSPATREKYALALISIGSADKYITDTLAGASGEKGLMALVFALHIVNNGYTADGVTADVLTGRILALQKDDGGFAVMGSYGDADCTAMTVTALAPQYRKNSKVKAACDKALSFLSSAQQPNGVYKSMGKENCESTAQVLLALSSLGIDAGKDERFIKGGNTLIDALATYRLQDGSFEHIKGEGANESATYQAFYCLTGYERMAKGKSAFFVFDNAKPPVNKPDKPDKPRVTERVTVTKASSAATKKQTGKQTKQQTEKPKGTTALSDNTAADTPSATKSSGGGAVTSGSTKKTEASKSGSAKTTKKTTSAETSQIKGSTSDSVTETSLTAQGEADVSLTDTDTQTEVQSTTTTAVTGKMVDEVYHETSIKVYIYIGIGGAVLIACVVLIIKGRRNIKSYILIIAIGGVLCAVTALLDIETKDEHFATNDSSSASESAGQVTVSVDCLTIMGLRDDIPEDGYLIPSQTVSIREGETAYDLLDELARENGILLDIKGSDEMIYVSGIAGIYEFDHGELSGWMYYVNGQAPSVNSSQYILKDGDVVEWRYTKEIGRDIE